MGNENVKRNSKHETVKADKFQGDLFPGVGGRQGCTPAPAGGGGYQDICSVLNFDPTTDQKKRDPRLEELRQMGLQRMWLDVAEEIGVDALLKMWRILDQDKSSIGDDGRLLVPLRSYSTYIRYQRNRYIESLATMGMKPREIQQKLNAQLCEQISIRHISRLITQD
ncbi:MAG: hypothetical protein B7Y56_03235 [Gallionellales bacterium 35-53-114]|jgi:hypothetical protein|nr:MAG: hypothetical protein B7Y56_03235 [Gallionellales bacterium 35-53-114]OYZ65119.1 MAG: hypothetical protein B7Y04_00395 [Gallionellales bacterium 24-53-125]OZB08027.1 MAG: hypothetical protein B7X61_10845 [Gallionellales bacterium 39-52-133]HQS59930.1 hypothetical protein [Gallionellaceae bacterium]HQS76688.1 hypothetical protein [Gallionellaceae bacterium]